MASDTASVGPARTALNHSSASIHDAAHAQRLGFRGSAVGGNLHLDLFAPLLVATYGEEWFEHGAVSVYFQNIVISGETVQAVVEKPVSTAAQTRIYARRADQPSIIVCEGTASLGSHERSELSTRDLRTCDDGQLRLLNGVKPGKIIGSMPSVVTSASQLAHIDSGSINEPMAWYREESPWGGPIASIGETAGMMFRLLTGVEQDGYWRLANAIGDTSGMFGAFEIAFVNGPVFLDQRYTVEGKVVGVGESPRTEYVWWDAVARDERGVPIARMRHQLRFIKASSALYGTDIR